MSHPMPATSPASPEAAREGVERVRVLTHRGRRIVLLDLSAVTDRAVGAAVVTEARRIIGAGPADGTVLTCTDVRGATYSRESIDRFKALSKANAPYVKAAAVVSDSPMHRAVISMVGLFSRRKLATFDSREAALDWLATQ